MENASANADPDAHVPQLASGGEDGIFGTSGPEQYRCSMRSTDTVQIQYARDILLRNYVSCAGEADFQWPGDRVGASWCHICHLWL